MNINKQCLTGHFCVLMLMNMFPKTSHVDRVRLKTNIHFQPLCGQDPRHTWWIISECSPAAYECSRQIHSS